MTHFIYDNTALDFPKIDESILAPEADPAQFILADNWNKTCQALLDVKGAFRGAKWVGVEAQPVDPAPSGVADYIWVSNTGILNVKRGGTNNQVVYTTRQITTGEGITGGGNLGGDLSLALDPLSPNPEGTYSRASIVVDAYGRITEATSNAATAAYALMQNDADILEDRATLHVDGTVLILEDDPTNVWTHLRLADTAVTPGSYTYAAITVDAQGRLTAASSGAAPALASTVLTGGTGINTIGDLSAGRTVSLANTSVTPGSYTYAGFTVDQQGRLTAASSGAAPALASTTLTGGTGINTIGDLSANRTVSLANTSVTPASYTYASFTVDQQGRLTAASNGATPALAATQIFAGTGMSGGGTLAADRTLNLANTSVTPGAYTYASITVDQQGRLTAASSGSAPVLPSRQVLSGTGLGGGGDLSADRTLSVNQATAFAWTGSHTWDPGSSPVSAISFLMTQPVATGQRNSHSFLMRGTSFDTVGHNADWQMYVDVTGDAGASTFIWETRIDAGSFAPRFAITDAGRLIVYGGLSVTGNVGFFGVTPVAQATGGENVTNNVTSGGVTGTIADLTTTVGAASAGADTVDITTVPLKADLEARLATIANDLYQVTRLLKQDHDQLRALGFLT